MRYDTSIAASRAVVSLGAGRGAGRYPRPTHKSRHAAPACERTAVPFSDGKTSLMSGLHQLHRRRATANKLLAALGRSKTIGLKQSVSLLVKINRSRYWSKQSVSLLVKTIGHVTGQILCRGYGAYPPRRSLDSLLAREPLLSLTRQPLASSATKP